ncbi:uncharacterized protein LOC113779675 [Coffea eugenioides]|nr:uncharacterized protein LOC113779675 [Coffea eugenioides]
MALSSKRKKNQRISDHSAKFIQTKEGREYFILTLFTYFWYWYWLLLQILPSIPLAVSIAHLDASSTLYQSMVPQSLSAPPSSSPTLLSTLKPSLLSVLKPPINLHRHHIKLLTRKVRNGKCRAEFSADTPIGVAIGACILNSLAFPIPSSPEDDDEGDSVIDSADARFAVMGIISFIPYFNWLSWFFAWLDTGKRRYAVYAIVYLAPYVRPNLSISPEDSWLPIASILLCIIHVQLEASIKNGDFQGFQLFSEVAKHLPSNAANDDEEKENDNMNLPSAQERYRNNTGNSGKPRRKPFKDSTSLDTEDGEADEGKKH